MPFQIEREPVTKTSPERRGGGPPLRTGTDLLDRGGGSGGGGGRPPRRSTGALDGWYESERRATREQRISYASWGIGVIGGAAGLYGAHELNEWLLSNYHTALSVLSYLTLGASGLGGAKAISSRLLKKYLLEYDE